jgi:magnesium chelatase subunit I
MAITDANAWTERETVNVQVPAFMKEIVEEVSRLARSSPAINQQSGVSVRMSIANCESMISSAERRGVLTGESVVVPRISDLASLVASSRGKIELTMSEEDGQEDRVLERLLAEAVKNVFEHYFDVKRFRQLVEWFESGNTFSTGDLVPSAEYARRVEALPMLKESAKKLHNSLPGDLPRPAEEALLASALEFILEGLHVENRLNKNRKAGQTIFKR